MAGKFPTPQVAVGGQISVTITPKDFYNESQEPEE